MKIRKIERSLPVTLTYSELMQRSRDLARASQDLSKVMSRKKEVISSLAAQQKACEAAIEVLSLAISTGEEYRDIECEVIVDAHRMTKTFVRVDTGEEIEQVRATQDDFQTSFD